MSDSKIPSVDSAQKAVQVEIVKDVRENVKIHWIILEICGRDYRRLWSLASCFWMAGSDCS